MNAFDEKTEIDQINQIVKEYNEFLDCPIRDELERKSLVFILREIEGKPRSEYYKWKEQFGNFPDVARIFKRWTLVLGNPIQDQNYTILGIASHFEIMKDLENRLRIVHLDGSFSTHTLGDYDSNAEFLTIDPYYIESKAYKGNCLEDSYGIR